MFSKGNRKLPKETLIFNLPSGKTCPYSTEECKKWCYAKKAEKMYPNVLPFRERNFVLSKTDKRFIIEAEDCLKKMKWEQVRIHESGDFYNQTYFNKWVKIIKEFGNKIFYAYTKNNTINMEDKPKNMILLYSDDKRKSLIKDLKKKGFQGRTRVINSKDELKKNETLCTGDCKTCDYCYTNTKEFKQVAFIKH